MYPISQLVIYDTIVALWALYCKLWCLCFCWHSKQKVFPNELALKTHNPFFSLEEPEAWAEIEAVQMYLRNRDAEMAGKLRADGGGRTTATIADLKSYRHFVSAQHCECCCCSRKYWLSCRFFPCLSDHIHTSRSIMPIFGYSTCHLISTKTLFKQQTPSRVPKLNREIIFSQRIQELLHPSLQVQLR